MDVPVLTRRGAALCHELAEGQDVLPDLLEMLCACVGTDLVTYATLTTSGPVSVPGSHDRLLLHGCDPLSEQELQDWARLLPTHPYAAHLAAAPVPCARLTEVVDLPTLARTEVFERCLQPYGARYQGVMLLDRSPGSMVVLSLWRATADFTDQEMEALVLLGHALEAATVVGQNLEALRRLAGPGTRGEQLSPRQQQVATMVALGLTNDQIARRLGLTVRTVRKHLEDAFARTGARSRTELAVRWRQSARSRPEVTAAR